MAGRTVAIGGARWPSRLPPLDGHDTVVLLSGGTVRATPARVIALGDDIHWYEDEHAIYVQAGLGRQDGRWLHPIESDVPDPTFRSEYEGKLVVVPGSASSPCVIGLDDSAVLLPERTRLE